MVKLMVVLAQLTYTTKAPEAGHVGAQGQWSSNPAIVTFSALQLTLFVYCAYKTYSNGHSMLFFFGFCFPLLWVVGAFMGRKY